MSKRLPVGRLWTDSVSVTPVTIDWQERLGENLDGWTSYEAFTCDECSKRVVCTGIVFEEEHRHIDEESECMGHLYAEGPMMNYYYPLPDLKETPEESALAIAHLPLCLVDLEDTWALALTGGGMDLSWQICEAFMRLGWLPPVHFCDLPRMAGMTLSAKNNWIIAGCRRSCEVVRWRAARGKQKLSRLRQGMKAEGLKVAA